MEPVSKISQDDGYFKALVKLIPKEIVAVYLSVVGIVFSLPEDVTSWLTWVLWGVCIVLVPIYGLLVRKRITVADIPAAVRAEIPGLSSLSSADMQKIASQKLHWSQAFIIGPLAFIAWSLVIPSPFQTLDEGTAQGAEIVGSVLVTLLSGIVFPLIGIYGLRNSVPILARDGDQVRLHDA